MAVSMLVSLVGTQMQNAAIDWHVWVLTRSPLALGFVGLVRVVPIVILSLVGGLVAQRAWGRLARVVAGGAPFALMLAAYQKIAFGSVFAAPYTYEKLSQYRTLARTGIFGLQIPSIAILGRQCRLGRVICRSDYSRRDRIE